jgi:hypothetical protein
MKEQEVWQATLQKQKQQHQDVMRQHGLISQEQEAGV